MWNSKRETDRTDFRTLWEKARVGWFERITLKCVYYHMWNRSLVQIHCMKQGTKGRCTGTTLRDGMGREVGGISGWGMHAHPWLIYVNVWQNSLQYCKVIAAKSLQSYPTLWDPIKGSPPGSASLGFPRQEHWSGLPFPAPVRESEEWKWSRSVVSDSLWHHGLQPAGSSAPGIFQARVLEWVAIASPVKLLASN